MYSSIGKRYSMVIRVREDHESLHYRTRLEIKLQAAVTLGRLSE